jgi:deazaflavin-dependent oxidoreductase (nitroreductase family)
VFDWKTFNPEVIAEFRANGGRVARLGDVPVVILHTRGARSGTVREVPLIVVHEGDETLLYATAAGSQKQPDWVFNLRAHPRILVETGQEEFMADVHELPEDEAAPRIAAQIRNVKQFADYAKSAAPRVIPIFRITRV